MLTWAGEEPRGWRIAVMAAAVGVLAVGLLRLFPRGAVSARAGIGAVVAGRWLISAAFFTSVAYLPLTLTATHGWSVTAAGTPLIAGSLAWSAASAWQGRRPELPRDRILRTGFVCVALGLLGLLAVTPAAGLPWVAYPAMTLAGAGMGLGFSSLSFLMLAHSEPTDVGFHSSAVQLADQMSQAVAVGLGGALLALLVTPTAMTTLVLALTALAVVGALLSPRTQVRDPLAR